MNTLLAEKLQGVFKNIRGYGKLTESNVKDAVREVRMALLAADVNYKVAKEFCDRVKEKAMGEEVQTSIRPGDLFVKIVSDELVALFEERDSSLKISRPLRIMLCGLNGAGKTTTAAKLARRLKKADENVLLVAADLSRPAAVEQLKTLGKQIEVPVHAPDMITKEGLTLSQHLKAAAAKQQELKATVTIYDLAGRTEVDDELLAELKEAAEIIDPHEGLLVSDAALGQQATEVANAFMGAVPLTGIILSKLDGDARGGAALSLQSVTNCPIKFSGTGEKIDALEPFRAQGFVNRMLGMGDIVSLVEKAQEEISITDAANLMEKITSQKFDLQDFLGMMRQLQKLGPLKNLLGMMPRMSNLPDSAIDEKAMKRTEAIILSMTPKERKKPEILNARRRQRIANGSGTHVRDVNELMKRFKGMKKQMGRISKGGPQQMLKRMMGGGGLGL